MLLEVRNISKAFGGVRAVRGVSFDLDRGDTVGIIGPNGAGKTTVFNVISGIYPPDAGVVVLDGVHLERMTQYEITRAGLARTFQNIRLFSGMNVLENVMTAGDHACSYGFFSSVLNLPKKRAMERRNIALCMEILAMMSIEKYALEKPGSLPYGVQRMVEIARALAAGPKVLMLDEPAAGLNPNEVREFTRTIRRIKDELGISVLIIEHHMEIIMEICRYIYVMDFGEPLAEGTPDEIRGDGRVTKAYIGEEDD
ncbi:MAG: ABC transporter ATP-binding protein [Synergistaceae bacterium]|jgi:branched-chain amino acid transport system ATP-binding protein|nr:ABC transporter ATP-binding protein [Synergistaceae bacterium]